MKTRVDVCITLKGRYGLLVRKDHVPSKRVFELLEPWVDWADAAELCNLDTDQFHYGPFLGWCPLHDPKRDGDHSAEYDFDKGVIRCWAHPSCFAQPGRRERNCTLCEKKHSMVSATSIDNLLATCAERQLALLG